MTGSFALQPWARNALGGADLQMQALLFNWLDPQRVRQICLGIHRNLEGGNYSKCNTAIILVKIFLIASIFSIRLPDKKVRIGPLRNQVPVCGSSSTLCVARILYFLLKRYVLLCSICIFSSKNFSHPAVSYISTT